MKTVYQAEDGSIHETMKAALDKESNGIVEKYTNFAKVCGCYQVKQLLMRHSIGESGLWEIRGEDPNCDFGGSHHEPLIGRYDCTLEKAIQIAADSQSFFGWGSGGSIKLNEFKKM